MAKDKKEEIDFKEVYGNVATIKAQKILEKEKIDLEKRIIYYTSKRKIPTIWI